jgi:transposase
VAELKRQLRLAHLKIQVLEEKLSLLELEPGVSQAKVAAEAEREPLPEPAPTKARSPARPHPGRQELPADLSRRERVLIGYQTSEQLDVELARCFVLVTKREMRACPRGVEAGMAVAPPRIVEKGLVSDRVVIDTIVAKFVDHLPPYRQSARLEREAGVEIHRPTLDG